MCAVHELGIEGPNMRWPGQKPTAPVYLSGLNGTTTSQPGIGNDGQPDPLSPYTGLPQPVENGNQPYVMPRSHGSIRSTRETDFSLGMKDMETMDDSEDIFNDTGPRRGVLPSTLRRVAEEHEPDDTSSKMGRSASHRSKDSHTSFLRRRRANSGATTTGQGIGHGAALPGAKQTGPGGHLWGWRSHDQENEHVLPVSEPIARSGTMPTLRGAAKSERRVSLPSSSRAENVEMHSLGRGPSKRV